MPRYSLSQLSDHALLRDLAALVARDRSTTAELLAHLAEVDARQLYLPAAYPSMFAYCVGELRLSEDAAFKRIKAARAARGFPAIFEAVAAGRLHLSAVVLLAPHLTEGTADELLVAATHRTKSEIERLLAERFPRPDVLAWVGAIPAASAARSTEPQAPGPVGEDLQLDPERVGGELQQAPGPVEGRHAPREVVERSRVTPLSPQSFAVQFTLSQRAHDQLRYAQELLGHQIPGGEIAAVFERALDALIGQLEKRKFAATPRPRPPQSRPSSPRTIPAHVKRTVWVRDGGQCTFVSSAGRRCEARTFLEFDHIDEVARGGEATVAGIRLRCRAHNQYAAECTFGPEFMNRKRQEARQAAADARRALARERAQEVIPWLQRLGFRADEARRAAALCERIPEAPIEERVRVALSHFGPRTSSRGRVTPASAGCAP